MSYPGIPPGFIRHFAELDELQLQVRTLGGDWDALIQTAARFPEPMAAIWRVIHDYLVSLERPLEGSLENAICAEYVLRVKARPFPPPNQFGRPTDSSGGVPAQHAFVPEAFGVDLCQLCKGRANSAIHRPGAPR